MSNNNNDRSNAPEYEHWLSTLLSALESLERNDGRLSGRRRGDRTTVDYNISIDTGLDRSSGNAFNSIRSGGEIGGVFDRPQDRRHRWAPPDSHHSATYVYDDELIVTADIGGADPEDVTVGFDDSTLVVAVSGSELERVDVPWRDTTVDTTIKNGVLTVTIEPESEASPTSESNDI